MKTRFPGIGDPFFKFRETTGTQSLKLGRARELIYASAKLVIASLLVQGPTWLSLFLPRA